MPILNSRNGFKGNIYLNHKTAELSSKLLKDCCKIHNSNVKYLKSKGERVDLLYDEHDLSDCLDHCIEVDVNKTIQVDPNLKFIFRHNSHTIDSCNITVLVKKPSNNRWYSVVYTSDMGSKLNYEMSNFLEEQDIPMKCNIFISEGTYCSNDESRVMTKKLANKEREELKKTILSSLKQGRKILMPTFSFSRSQQLAVLFYEWFKDDEWIRDNDIKFVMDSNLMLEINKTYGRILEGEDKELFEKAMNWKHLKKIDTYDGSMAFLKDKSPSVLLSSSGFLEAGKVTMYLPIYLGNSKSDIILTGYCSQDNEGSMAWKLLNDNQKSITFTTDIKGEKKVVNKKAKIYQFRSFSSHISRLELMQLFSEVDCDKIILHHMNNDCKDEFVKDCKDYIMSKNKTTPIVAVNKGCSQFVL